MVCLVWIKRMMALLVLSVLRRLSDRTCAFCLNIRFFFRKVYFRSWLPLLSLFCRSSVGERHVWAKYVRRSGSGVVRLWIGIYLKQKNSDLRRKSLSFIVSGGRSDSNRRPTEPQSGTLTNWATTAIWCLKKTRQKYTFFGYTQRCW